MFFIIKSMRGIPVELSFLKKMESSVNKWKLKKSLGVIQDRDIFIIINNLLDGKSCNNCAYNNYGQIRNMMECFSHKGKSQKKVGTCIKWKKK